MGRALYLLLGVICLAANTSVYGIDTEWQDVSPTKTVAEVVSPVVTNVVTKEFVAGLGIATEETGLTNAIRIAENRAAIENNRNAIADNATAIAGLTTALDNETQRAVAAENGLHESLELLTEEVATNASVIATLNTTTSTLSDSITNLNGSINSLSAIVDSKLDSTGGVITGTISVPFVTSGAMGLWGDTAAAGGGGVGIWSGVPNLNLPPERYATIRRLIDTANGNSDTYAKASSLANYATLTALDDYMPRTPGNHLTERWCSIDLYSGRPGLPDTEMDSITEDSKGSLNIRTGTGFNYLTSYGYSGITARRNAVNYKYLFDDSADGIVRKRDLSGYATALQTNAAHIAENRESIATNALAIAKETERATTKEAAISASLAPAFSESKTYAVGELVTHDGRLYICKTAVTTPGEWDSTDWTDTTVRERLASKQDRLVIGQNFDSFPTANSTNAVMSGGVASRLTTIASDIGDKVSRSGDTFSGNVTIENAILTVRDDTNDIEADANTLTRYTNGVEVARVQWGEVIAAARGTSTAYAKPADIVLAMQAATNYTDNATNSFSSKLFAIDNMWGSPRYSPWLCKHDYFGNNLYLEGAGTGGDAYRLSGAVNPNTRFYLGPDNSTWLAKNTDLPPAPDYTTNNNALVETIQEAAGLGYLAVSSPTQPSSLEIVGAEFPASFFAGYSGPVSRITLDIAATATESVSTPVYMQVNYDDNGENFIAVSVGTQTFSAPGRYTFNFRPFQIPYGRTIHVWFTTTPNATTFNGRRKAAVAVYSDYLDGFNVSDGRSWVGRTAPRMAFSYGLLADRMRDLEARVAALERGGGGVTVNYDTNTVAPTSRARQLLPKAVRLNGGMFGFHSDALDFPSLFECGFMKPVIVPESASLDVDTPEDLAKAMKETTP